MAVRAEVADIERLLQVLPESYVEGWRCGVTPTTAASS